ncbi:efflux RND transporter periplasmic adaptor subunit [Thermomonas sp.]|uniref:efflux RND transporter periplasmic adaptor subunit n=1 Tax=Thermomonas sp. TaxID=1971895 RepID=UPI0039E47D9A
MIPAPANRQGRLPTITRHALLGLAVALALGGCKFQMGSGKDAKNEAAQAPEAVPVEVARAARRTLTASYSGATTLLASNTAQVTAKVSGEIKRIWGDVGDTVRAGQPLMQLDTERASLQLVQARAQMLNLEANYARARKLVEQQMVSANDLDQIKYELEQARARYSALKLELSYATITAPISGVISARRTAWSPGNMIQIGQNVVEIVDSALLEAQLLVPEREIGRIKAGQEITLLADALPGKTFAGKVFVVSPTVDASSGTVPVICRFENKSGELMPGMYGRISVNYDNRADALAIPRAALLEDGGEPAVYVVRGEKVARVTLTLGYNDGPWVEVREGLKDGDQVVVAGKAALREGSLVKVLDAAAPVAKPAAEQAAK